MPALRIAEDHLFSDWLEQGLFHLRRREEALQWASELGRTPERCYGEQVSCDARSASQYSPGRFHPTHCRGAITLGFDSLRETFTFLPTSYPHPSSFEGSSSQFARSDRSENAAAGPSGTFQDDDEELGGSVRSEYI